MRSIEPLFDPTPQFSVLVIGVEEHGNVGRK
jgi:hypothetical protein